VSHEAVVVALREMINGSWVLKAIAAAELGLALIVVVGSRLGALNQTLLTFECARRRVHRGSRRAFARPPARGRRTTGLADRSALSAAAAAS
jgi:hypothetical protein